MSATESEYLASCHCGALQGRYRTAIPTAEWSVRACQCSFCLAHSALSTSDLQGSISFSAGDASQVQRYQFGGKSADFLICRNCGVYVGARFESPNGRFGILNIRALRPVPTNLPTPEAKVYDGESRAERMQRREARWTPLAKGSL